MDWVYGRKLAELGAMTGSKSLFLSGLYADPRRGRHHNIFASRTRRAGLATIYDLGLGAALYRW